MAAVFLDSCNRCSFAKIYRKLLTLGHAEHITHLLAPGYAQPIRCRNSRPKRRSLTPVLPPLRADTSVVGRQTSRLPRVGRLDEVGPDSMPLSRHPWCRLHRRAPRHRQSVQSERDLLCSKKWWVYAAFGKMPPIYSVLVLPGSYGHSWQFSLASYFYDHARPTRQKESLA